MDREAIARDERRRQVLQALDFERDREASLLEQLGSIVAEEEGWRVDEAAFAKMDPHDVTLVRDVLAGPEADEDEDSFDLDGAFTFAEDETEDDSSLDDEIGRLQDEIATSRARQQAYERYLEALGQ